MGEGREMGERKLTFVNFACVLNIVLGASHVLFIHSSQGRWYYPKMIDEKTEKKILLTQQMLYR